MKLFLNTKPFKTCYHIEGNLNELHKNLVLKILSNCYQEFIPDEDFFKNILKLVLEEHLKHPGILMYPKYLNVVVLKI